MDSRILKILTFLLSLFLYVAILFLLLEYFFHHPTTPQKVQVKADAIEVYVAKKEEKKKIIPHKQKTPPKKIAPKKATGSHTPKASLLNVDKLFANTPIPKPKAPDINNLFAKVKIPKAKPKKREPRREAPSRFKGRGGKKVEELFKNLHLKEPKPASKQTIKSVTGKKEDPYLQEVYKILYASWMPSTLSAGSRGKVLIRIDKYGNFSYEILEFSQNEMFNAELIEYLKQIAKQRFPVPQQTREFVVYFEAKN